MIKSMALFKRLSISTALPIFGVVVFHNAEAIIIKNSLWEPVEPDGYLEYVSDHDRFGDEHVGTTRIVNNRNSFSSYLADNHHFGNIADLDWVEDDRKGLGPPDNHTGPDYLVWQTGNPQGPDHTGHNHGVGPLENATWTNPTFRYVDVFTLLLVLDDNPDFSDISNEVIDFTVWGSDDKQSWNPATQLVVWTEGWIPDGTWFGDFVVRWDLGANYRFVGIRALDRENAQIDAVKALNTPPAAPEPSTLALVFFGIVISAYSQWRSRTLIYRVTA
jgi:hypothetical protein